MITDSEEKILERNDREHLSHQPRGQGHLRGPRHIAFLPPEKRERPMAPDLGIEILVVRVSCWKVCWINIKHQNLSGGKSCKLVPPASKLQYQAVGLLL